MTRRPFGGGSGDFVEQVAVDGTVHANSTVVVAMWSAATAGTQIVDLTNGVGTGQTAVTTNAFGQIPLFYGPNDGTSQLWADAGGTTRQRLDCSDIAARVVSLEASGTPTRVATKTGAYTASAEDLIPIDTTSAAVPIQLPDVPPDKTRIAAKVILGTVGSNGLLVNNATMLAGGTSVFNKSGGSTTLTIQMLNQGIEVEYQASGNLWTVVNDSISLGGLLALQSATYAPIVNQSTTAVVTATSGTITTTATGSSRVNPAGNITGVILQPGTVAGQKVVVVNESAFTITFAAAGTSNVSDGVSDIIVAITAREYIWDSGPSLWYRVT